MRSLTAKLVLAFLIVSLSGVVLVALAVGLRTQREFDQFLSDRDRDRLAAALVQHYRAAQSWEGVEAVFRQHYPDGRHDLRPASLVLADAEGRILAGTGPGAVNRRVPPSDLMRGIALKSDGRVVGWLIPGPFAAYRGREGLEQIFLARVNQAILFSALGAMAVAWVLGTLLARALARPLHELTAATQAVAKGDLGRQVTVRSDDELGRLAASFNRMSADLALASQLRRQMTADIAHELRTPLSMILGYTEGLCDGKLQGTPETFEIMHAEAQRLKRLIEDLRMLSLADAGELPLTRRPVAPQALLEHVALAYAAQAEGQGVLLRVKAEPFVPAINVDRDRMTQVLGNLVSNALRYTPAGGQITLSAGQHGDQVVLRVQDSGLGIAAQDLPHIFDRFYRGDKARSRQDGESGLGLAIARSLVEMHGGTIAAKSLPGQGATFVVTLPPACASA